MDPFLHFLGKFLDGRSQLVKAHNLPEFQGPVGLIRLGMYFAAQRASATTTNTFWSS